MNRLKLSRRQWVLGMIGAAIGGRLGAGSRATGGDVPWLAELQQSPHEPLVGARGLTPLLVDAQGLKITTLAGWLARRAELRRWWLDFLHPWDADFQRPPTFKVLAEDRPDGAIRQLIGYEVEPGLMAEAYLLKPRDPSGRRPGVLAFHSTVESSIREPAGMSDRPGLAFGLELARRDCVALCPRNFLWTQAGKLAADAQTKRFAERHPGSLGMAKMLFDGRIALSILAAMPEVDPQRLGTIGHSLGSKEALYLAAFDERVRAAVCSEGGIGTRFSNWQAPWYLGPGIQEPTFTHEHHELLGLVAPRPLLIVGGDSADGARTWPFIEAAMPVYKLYAAGAPLGLLNHHQGHTVPPEIAPRMHEWLTVYLGGGRD